ncbi:MAG: succinylglutamate desuccinylase/aspartoacylase family protein [Bryobacteraceae bacterium]|nr:succinylglutamate desuccinylase/aspartoacylase family protein [Bryobacteraceae bacterium]
MSVTLIHNPASIDFDLPGAHHYQLAFPLDGTWGYSIVPLTVINGLRSGQPPGVAVFGGTHGNEYEGQIAVKRLCGDLDAAAMSGRVILMPQLSESACRAGQRISPEDGVNMNRAFPGSPRGALSYRIAHFVKTLVFPQVKIVVDLHAGGHEANFPLCTSLHPVADPSQYAEMIAAASLFDPPFVYVYSRQMASGLLTDEAEDEGKIAIGGEFGFGGGASPRGILHAYEGVRNLLKKYGLLEGAITPIDPARGSPPRIIAAPDLRDYVPCPRDCIWEPVLQPGEDVRAGDLIGRLHDFDDHTSPAVEIRAHKDGVIAALYFGAVCRKGLTLFVVAEDITDRI